MSTGFARPPQADLLHPWLQPFAPPGRMIFRAGSVRRHDTRLRRSGIILACKDVGNDKHWKCGARERAVPSAPNSHNFVKLAKCTSRLTGKRANVAGWLSQL